MVIPENITLLHRRQGKEKEKREEKRKKGRTF